MTGKTSTGFAYEIDPTKMDDMRVVDLLADLVDESVEEFKKIIAVSRVVTILLGNDQKAALYEHLAELNGGRVPVKVMEETLTEIMTGAGAGN